MVALARFPDPKTLAPGVHPQPKSCRSVHNQKRRRHMSRCLDAVQIEGGLDERQHRRAHEGSILR